MLIDINAENKGIEDTTGYDQHRRGINMISNYSNNNNNFARIAVLQLCFKLSNHICSNSTNSTNLHYCLVSDPMIDGKVNMRSWENCQSARPWCYILSTVSMVYLFTQGVLKKVHANLKNNQ